MNFGLRNPVLASASFYQGTDILDHWFPSLFLVEFLMKCKNVSMTFPFSLSRSLGRSRSRARSLSLSACLHSAPQYSDCEAGNAGPVGGACAPCAAGIPGTLSITPRACCTRANHYPGAWQARTCTTLVRLFVLRVRTTPIRRREAPPPPPAPATRVTRAPTAAPAPPVPPAPTRTSQVSCKSVDVLGARPKC